MLGVERANRLSLKALVKQRHNSPCTYGTNAPFFHFQTILTIIYRKCSKAVCVTLSHKSYSLSYLSLCNLYSDIFISCSLIFLFLLISLLHSLNFLIFFPFSVVSSFSSPSSSTFYSPSSTQRSSTNCILFRLSPLTLIFSDVICTFLCLRSRREKDQFYSNLLFNSGLINTVGLMHEIFLHIRLTEHGTEVRLSTGQHVRN